MRLFYKKGIITPKDDKTNIPLEFEVNGDFDIIRVSYSYYPKTVSNEETALKTINEKMRQYDYTDYNAEDYLPVKNLVTLSFDDPLGYRGACHRQPNEQKIIIGKNSTSGIENRENPRGKWRIVLNVHYAGCNIDYEIGVSGE